MPLGESGSLRRQRTEQIVHWMLSQVNKTQRELENKYKILHLRQRISRSAHISIYCVAWERCVEKVHHLILVHGITQTLFLQFLLCIIGKYSHSRPRLKALWFIYWHIFVPEKFLILSHSRSFGFAVTTVNSFHAYDNSNLLTEKLVHFPIMTFFIALI